MATTTKKWTDLKAKMSPALRAKIDAEKQALVREMPLQELRKARALTQATMASAMNIGQGEVSKIEQRTDVYVSTLRSYIEAMGGELEIRARFRDGDVVEITQFQELEETAK
jgi:hypothetical protein